MKRKLLALFLALVLCVGIAVPAMAADKYDYESLTLTDRYGPDKEVCASYTFEQAASGYRITYRSLEEAGYPPELIIGSDIVTLPCVILKDNSRMSVELADNFHFDWDAPAGYSKDFSEIVLFETDAVAETVVHLTGYCPEVTTGKVEQLFKHADGPSVVNLAPGLVPPPYSCWKAR